MYFLTPTVLKMDVSCSDQTRLEIKGWNVDLIVDSAQAVYFFLAIFAKFGDLVKIKYENLATGKYYL